MNPIIKDIKMIQNLVGDINESDLKYVDYYISEHLGIFIPSVGFCEYAIKPNHIHPSYSFILVFSEGQSIIKRQIDLKPKHYLMAALSPSVPHEEEKSEIFTRYIALFISKEFYEKEYMIYNSNKPLEYIWEQFIIDYDIMIYLKKFMSEYDNKACGYKNMLEALASVITNYLIRSILNVCVTEDFIVDKMEMNRVIEYMHQHYDKKLSNLQLSKIANMSESHFIRVFKKETSMSPIDYLVKLRIDKSKKLLKSGSKNITEISLMCGFNSPSHYSSSFLRHENITPSEYQNLYLYNT